MRILVIEDEESIREEVVEWLTLDGHDVVEATNGRQGVEFALSTFPELIISDITMPEMDGYSVLLELRQNPSLRSVPFVFLTARSDRSFFRHGMELGADDYVTKPFTHAELMASINACLSRHKSIKLDMHQEVSDLKTKIMRIVSHELKTPFVSLKSVQEVIERQWGQLSAQEMEELFQTMRIGTDRLQHVVQQIVYLTQIDSSALSRDVIRETGMAMDIGQVLFPAIDLARRYAFRNSRGNIVLHEHDSRSLIWGNNDLLKHAFAEILANALNFSPIGRDIVVTAWRSDGCILVSIKDHGVGMSNGDTAQAQEAFEQIGRSRSEQQGLGLGLTVTHQIVDIHGGFLQIESVIGKGTEVRISLPEIKDIYGVAYDISANFSD